MVVLSEESLVIFIRAVLLKHKNIFVVIKTTSKENCSTPVIMTLGST